MGKKHKKLPPLHVLEELFEYDPVLGGIFKKGDEHIEQLACGSWTKSGHLFLYVKGYGLFLAHRIAFYMFHRKDPGAYLIDHKNGDRADNRIHNLRRCRATANARNLRSKGKYVVDSEGVGRWVSGVCA